MSSFILFFSYRNAPLIYKIIPLIPGLFPVITFINHSKIINPNFLSKIKIALSLGEINKDGVK